MKTHRLGINTLALLFAAGLSFSTTTSFANDGGIPYIKVKSMTTSLLAGDNLAFKGGEAYKLYKVLPQDYVYDVSRSLVITSKDKAVTISCHQEEKPGSSENPVGDPKTTECQISVTTAFDPKSYEGDSWNWEPRTCERR